MQKKIKLSTLLVTFIVSAMLALAIVIMASIVFRASSLFGLIEKTNHQIIDQISKDSEENVVSLKRIKLQNQVDLFAAILIDNVITSDLEALDNVVSRVMKDKEIIYMEVQDAQSGPLTTIKKPTHVDMNHIVVESLIKSSTGTLLGKVILWGDTAQLHKALQAIVERGNALAKTNRQQLRNLLKSELLQLMGGVGIIIIMILIPTIFIIRTKVIKPIIGTLTPFNHVSLELARSAEMLTNAGKELKDSVSAQGKACTLNVESMDSMKTMIEKTSKQVTELFDSAGGIKIDTNEGNKLIERLAQSLEELLGFSDQLGRIPKVIQQISSKTKIINDIVFKTQLLSFNASIEAARAGENGKGFAVVAEEVRLLAANSGKAANEIHIIMDEGLSDVTNIVDSINSSLKGSNKVANKTRNSFSNITRSVSHINENVGKINKYANKQLMGVQEILQMVKQLERSAQVNNDIASNALNQALDIDSSNKDMKEATKNLSVLVHGKEA